MLSANQQYNKSIQKTAQDFTIRLTLTFQVHLYFLNYFRRHESNKCKFTAKNQERFYCKQNSLLTSWCTKKFFTTSSHKSNIPTFLDELFNTQGCFLETFIYNCGHYVMVRGICCLTACQWSVKITQENGVCYWTKVLCRTARNTQDLIACTYCITYKNRNNLVWILLLVKKFDTYK